MKQAIITPLLKKPTLDRENLKNYRPVSKLSFFAKLFERVAAAGIHQHLRTYNLYPDNQSAYCADHSVKTALLCISNTIVTALDDNKGIIMVLLDLSAAFDTIDHTTLLRILRNHFGIVGLALDWIKSYLSNRARHSQGFGHIYMRLKIMQDYQKP